MAPDATGSAAFDLTIERVVDVSPERLDAGWTTPDLDQLIDLLRTAGA